MFDFEIHIFNLIFRQCKILGSSFGFGAFEGFVVYASCVALGIVKGLNESNSKKVVKK